MGELSEVNTHKPKTAGTIYRVALEVGRVTNALTTASALVYKPFCTETRLRHYSQTTNAKLAEPLDIKPK